MGSNLPPSDEDIARVAAIYEECDRNQSEAAKAAGMDRCTFRRWLRRAAAKGLLLDHPPAMPGFEITSVTTDPNGGKHVQQRPEAGEEFEPRDGLKITGESAYVDQDNRVIRKWVLTREERQTLSIQDAVAACNGAFDNVKPAKPTKAPRTPGAADFATLVPGNDWHIGMFSWGKENPQQGVSTNWDLPIAESTIGDASASVVERSRRSRVGIMLGGGDLFHADNKENKTSRSGNVLDVDGRYQKVMQVACRLKVRTIDAMLAQFDEVIVRILPGNHDEHSAVAVAYYLSAYYRNEPRVAVDLDPSLFWWHRFGNVMLGATHGHTVKLEKMPMIMANRRPEDWGATRHRYIHGFHIHHVSKYAMEGEGCLMESHQAPIPPDAWHYGSGYITGQSIQAITYHQLVGEYGRVREPIILLPNAAANDNKPTALRKAA